MRRAPAATLAALCLASVAQPTPGVVVSRITTPGTLRLAGMLVAINPVRPDHNVAALVQGGRPGEPRVSNHAYVSEDGGRNWSGWAVVNRDGRLQGRDAVAFGLDGVAYHCDDGALERHSNIDAFGGRVLIAVPVVTPDGQ